jgi:hypothetical protein
VLPGAIGVFVAFGMMLMVQYLPADCEDGNLLRAKATPDGILGYLAWLTRRPAARTRAPEARSRSLTR